MVPSNQLLYYTNARTDQSGRQILRFYEMDAYVRARGDGGILGGACPSYKAFKQLTADDVRRHVAETVELLDFLGLNETFPYACPSLAQEQLGLATWVGPKQLREQNFDFLYTAAWLKSLRARVRYPDPPQTTGRLQIAVHLRRGDVAPCQAKKAAVARYLPNTYYLKLMDLYLPQYCGDDPDAWLEQCDITIYSQSKSYESFDVFLERGYGVELDTPLTSVWTAFLHANVLVLSESAFSYAAAYLARNATAIYAPRTADNLYIPPYWTSIEAYSGLMQAAHLETQSLIQRYCGST